MKTKEVQIYAQPLEVHNVQILDQVEALNRQGKAVIFAPNHLAPYSSIRENLALADDYPRLNKLLLDHGIRSRVVFRGDGDIEVRNSTVMSIIYDVHRIAFSTLGTLVTGGIPIAINAKEPKLAQSRNQVNVKTMISTLRAGENLVIYPYGNWFKAGEQKFDEQILENGYQDLAAYDKWRNSLKSGFVRLAKLTGSSILPVFVDNTSGNWKFTFGNLLAAEKGANIKTLGDQYLSEMREMSAKKD